MRGRVTSIAALAALLSLSGTAPSAQSVRVPPELIEGKVLGWIKIYDYKGATLPIKLDQRVYSPAQLSIAQSFANWMQASYLPTGALGDVFQSRNEKLGLYNQNTAAEPQRYGAVAKLYDQLKYGLNKKIEPLTSDALFWTIEANGTFGVPAGAVSTPERYYFTLPTFAQQGFGDELEKASDVSRHPVLGRFPAFFMRNSASGNRKYILLSKDRKLPFVTLTKGEYLDAVGVAIARKYTAEKKRIAEAHPGNQKDIDYDMKDLDSRTAKRTATLEKNREKYSTRLKETAEISTPDPDLMLENYGDVFERYGNPTMRLPVYTIDPKVAELCKTDAPQWIVISWTAQLNDAVSKSLHDAMLNNLNVEYIYNYFFDPDKVKGQPYKPVRSPSFVEPVARAEPSAETKKNAADPTVHFFDDFSTTAAGTKPINWRSTLDSTGATSLVMELNGLDGHWTLVTRMQISPTQLKALPRDFEVSYDMMAGQNYAWGTRGLEFKLTGPAAAGTGESSLTLRIRPGFGGRPGEVMFETQFPGAQAYSSGTKWLGAPGFSNTAQYNRVTVTIKKKGELLQLFIDTTKIAEYEKGVPPGVQFAAMSFDLTGIAATEKMYISNIRIAAY